VGDLRPIPIAIKTGLADGAVLRCEPARRAVISWNTRAPAGEMWLRILRAGQPDGDWLPYVQWSAGGRKSFGATRPDATIDTDVLSTSQPFDGIEIRAEPVHFDLLALATPLTNTPSPPYAGPAFALEVPQRSQYAVEHERGWCSAASTAMLNAYYGHDRDVASTARAVFDSAYNGTGNWTFNMAFSGSLGLHAVVAYLKNLDHAARILKQNIPLAISYSWRGKELPGAPVEHSDGHLAVLCGFTAAGDCVVNDPAAPDVRTVYPRAAIEKIWLRNLGVAYVVAPSGTDLGTLLAA